MNESICAIMAPFAAAVAIVFLVLTYQLLKLRIAGRNLQEDAGEPVEGDAGQLADRAVRMEQRLGNLEEILRESGQQGRRSR